MRKLLAAAAFLGVLAFGAGGATLAEDGIRDGGTTWHRSDDGWRHDSNAFERLSPGNQKIVRALFEAQTTEHHRHHVWSLDRIAAAKDRGWGNVFKEMQAKGLIDAKNLGQVVSSYQHTATGASAGDHARTFSTATTISNARGRSRTYGGGSGDRMRGRTDVSDGKDEVGIVRAAKGSKSVGSADSLAAGVTSGGGRGAGQEHALGVATAGGAQAAAGITSANGKALGHGNGRGGGTAK